MRNIWTLLGALFVGSLGCVLAAPQSESEIPLSGISIGVDARPVPLNAAELSASAIGDFRYAGGLALSSQQTDRLHGLSDVEVTADAALTAVSDFGFLFQARLVLDAGGRLVGIADGRLIPLTGEDGQRLSTKSDADAEGLAELAGDGRLVSFERRHHILLYPKGGGLPRNVPAPAVSFASNAGMEALAADPETGADAYIVGAEDSGQTWECRLASTCVAGPRVSMSEGFGLVALRRLSGNRTAYLLRAFDSTRGNRNSLQIFRGADLIAQMDLARPMTVDNFEGVAAVPRADSSVRFYLLSDDNNRSSQQTFLLAFDWLPR